LNWAQLARRIRVPLGFVLGALYLWLAHPTPTTMIVGGVIALVGLLFRAWAAGHIVKNDQLATTGPYAHTRNPLYFGSFLLAAGFAIMGGPWLVLLVIVFFAVVYIPVIASERQQIRKRFPEAYAEWERHVPAFVPRPLPWRSGGAESRFSLDLYLRHKEWRAALAFAGAVAFLVWRMRSLGA
jgi:protein-S-isoprenylcysteine O-methyltransferase Ste14